MAFSQKCHSLPTGNNDYRQGTTEPTELGLLLNVIGCLEPPMVKCQTESMNKKSRDTSCAEALFVGLIFAHRSANAPEAW